MLSQMGNSMGDMGRSMGGSMFDPMIKLQEEERIRKQAEAERQTALARGQAIASSYQGPMKAYQAAKNQGDAAGARTAANALMDAAVQASDQATMQRAEGMLGQLNQIGDAGALKGVRAINQALTDPTLDDDAREAFKERKKTLMENSHVQSILQEEADAQTTRDAAELSITDKELSIQAKRRTAKQYSKGMKAVADGKSGAVAGSNVPYSATPKQLSQAKAGKSDEWVIAFDKARDSVVNRKAQMDAISLNEKMTREQFEILGDTGTTYEEYEKSANGKGVQSYAMINKAIRTRSDAAFMQQFKPDATVSKASDATRTEAREILMTSGDDVKGLVKYGQDVEPSEQDIYLLGLAMANTIAPNALMTYVVDGALTDDGRKAIYAGLQAKGVEIAEPKKKKNDPNTDLVAHLAGLQAELATAKEAEAEALAAQ
jgi:hypothetical protein